MFYKRERKEQWLGPGKVMFQDGKVVFIHHGSSFIRVSPNRLFKNPPTNRPLMILFDLLKMIAQHQRQHINLILM